MGDDLPADGQSQTGSLWLLGQGVTGLAKITARPDATAFAPGITNFYLTNPIARASQIMAELSQLKAGGLRRVAAE